MATVWAHGARVQPIAPGIAVGVLAHGARVQPQLSVVQAPLPAEVHVVSTPDALSLVSSGGESLVSTADAGSLVSSPAALSVVCVFAGVSLVSCAEAVSLESEAE